MASCLFPFSGSQYPSIVIFAFMSLHTELAASRVVGSRKEREQRCREYGVLGATRRLSAFSKVCGSISTSRGGIFCFRWFLDFTRDKFSLVLGCVASQDPKSAPVHALLEEALFALLLLDLAQPAPSSLGNILFRGCGRWCTTGNYHQTRNRERRESNHFGKITGTSADAPPDVPSDLSSLVLQHSTVCDESATTTTPNT